MVAASSGVLTGLTGLTGLTPGEERRCTVRCRGLGHDSGGRLAVLSRHGLPREPLNHWTSATASTNGEGQPAIDPLKGVL